MAHQFAVWHVGVDGPTKVGIASIDLEKHLEDWIERNPSLLEFGLEILGRQLKTAGGRVDLLARDPQGRWVVIELKKGRLYREALAQAIDYAACIADMTNQELQQKLPANKAAAATEFIDDRQLRIMLAGVGKDSSLDRIVSFLSSRYTIPITVVSFDVFGLPSGESVLVREVTETEGLPAAAESRLPTPEELLARAESTGIGPQFRKVLNAALAAGLHPRSFKNSLNVRAASKQNQSLVHDLGTAGPWWLKHVAW